MSLNKEILKLVDPSYRISNQIMEEINKIKKLLY